MFTFANSTLCAILLANTKWHRLIVMDFSQTELLCDICKDGSLWMLKKKKSLVVSDTYWYAKFFFFKSEHGYLSNLPAEAELPHSFKWWLCGIEVSLDSLKEVFRQILQAYLVACNGAFK